MSETPLTRAKHGFRSIVVTARSGEEGYVREKNDFYPTPRRAIQALLDVETFVGDIWEPACGDGAISRVVSDAGYPVISSDLVDRGYGETGVDFLMEYRPRASNIITNPPFKLAVPFVRQAVFLASAKVAMLLKLAFLEGKERSALFHATPLARVYVFSRRLSFVPPGTDEKQKDAAGMMSFAWFVWDHSHAGPPTLGWLP